MITVNETGYRKAFKEYRADPMKSEKQMVAQGIIINEIDKTGKMKVATDKSKGERETKLLNDIKKDNNFLELNLLK